MAGGKNFADSCVCNCDCEIKLSNKNNYSDEDDESDKCDCKLDCVARGETFKHRKHHLDCKLDILAYHCG